MHATLLQTSFVVPVVSAFCEVIGLPLTSVESDTEGVSRSESSSPGPLPPLPSPPASLAATVSTGAATLGGGGWRRSLECSERPLLTASSPDGWKH